MSTKIVFITSRYLHQPMLQALQRLNPEYSATVVTYNNFDHIAQVYDQYVEQADAFIVSGPSAKAAIERSHPKLAKPVISFQIGTDALYKDILMLLLENRQQDLDRVILDFLLPLGDNYTVRDFLLLQNLESVDARNQEWVRSEQTSALDAEVVIIKRIQQLWQQKAIDLVICQYSSIVPHLDALGIPYRCPFVSDRHLSELIRSVQTKVELGKMQNNLPAVIQISPTAAGTATQEHMRALLKYVRQFMKDHLLECAVQEATDAYYLFTSMQTLRHITANFEICRLHAFLNDKLPFPVAVGYGIGSTIPYAINNVHSAIRESKFAGSSYIKDVDGNLIGPLDSENRMVIDTLSFPDISHIAKKCSLSTMTVQKLITNVKLSGSDKITTQELASRFNITVRNANRILTNLCKGGAAKPVYTQTSSSRGRPIQVYELDFDAVSNN